MNKRLISNVYFNIIFPSFVAGISTLGVVYLFENDKMAILLGGMIGFGVGILIRNNFKWKKDKLKYVGRGK
jgi:hypothetical protein